MNSEETSARLPEYRHPPVVETALAIEFAKLPAWNVLHYGLLWDRFRSAYPFAEVHPGIVSLTPAGTLPHAGFTFDVASPPLRCFFISSDRTHLVQVQDGAFVHNWRIQPENHVYPRYEIIRPSFVKDLQIFYDFLRENEFPTPEVWKCEVTYVNHFIRGREWNDTSSLHRVFPTIKPEQGKLLSRPIQLQFTLNYELPQNSGNLQVQAVPALRPDGKELIQLSLTAFGKPRSSALDDLIEWIDSGRRAVVLGFSEFTSDEVQKSIWERIWP